MISTHHLDEAVDALITRVGPAMVMAAPLGLGKPHRLLNAIHARVSADPGLSLHLLTALSLAVPKPRGDFEQRFLQPFLERHFGADFPDLAYVAELQSDRLPGNIRIEEFYMQSGAMLDSAAAQRHYNSLNYTHVARTVAERDVNALAQKVAREPGGSRLSLSCNPDLTFDFLDQVERLGKSRPFLLAEVDPALPWLDGPCAVDADFFDLVVDPPAPHPQLFALPRQPVSDADYAIGLYASTLVRDGGTLQIGIGSLADALSHALVLRHTRNRDYLALLEALSPGLAGSSLVRAIGGTAPFEQGLYGASEMVNDGFRLLAERGILTRRVVDDLDAMRRLNRGEATDADLALCRDQGRWLEGAFYLGSRDLYRWLRAMPEAQARGLRMTRISEVNALGREDQSLQREQRRDARFFNSCMMMTALGAAVSDGLEDGRIVSGVGGQYNFVAMAHALDDGRSVLMCRAGRTHKGGFEGNIRWQYGHVTIPRHLRDIAITEYGIADLRGRCDADCAQAMIAIADARSRQGLLHDARAARKLAGDDSAEPSGESNTPTKLSDRLRPFRRNGLLPDYPLGSDFTGIEQRLVRALAWLSEHTATRASRLGTVARAVASPSDTGDVDDTSAALSRMDLAQPRGWRQRLGARLLRLALSKTR